MAQLADNSTGPCFQASYGAVVYTRNVLDKPRFMQVQEHLRSIERTSMDRDRS